MASMADLVKKASANNSGASEAPKVKVADSKSLNANSSSGFAA